MELIYEKSQAGRRAGRVPGYALGRDYEGLDDAIMVALTEKRTVADIEHLAEVLSDVLAEVPA